MPDSVGHLGFTSGTHHPEKFQVTEVMWLELPETVGTVDVMEGFSLMDLSFATGTRKHGGRSIRPALDAVDGGCLRVGNRERKGFLGVVDTKRVHEEFVDFFEVAICRARG